MIYKTVFGTFKDKYIESKSGVYWLTKPIRHKGSGYVLLHKSDNGSYEAIKMLKIQDECCK